MKKSKIQYFISGAVATILVTLISVLNVKMANAASFVVSPLNNYVIINPGDSYESSFKVLNPVGSENDIKYEVKMEHFYEGDDGAVLLEEVGDTGQILKWVTLKSEDTGTLAPNESAEIRYVINVPKDAAGGGQYVAFAVEAKNYDETDDFGEGTSTTLEQRMVIAYRVFVEVTGKVTRSGEILNVDVPGFLLSGNIFGSSIIKNTGNVHGIASYKLQVFPLFSDEEIYTNEENPITRTIMPDRSMYHDLAWEKTPSIGIFNVVYTVEFEGVTAQVKKMVIKCPIWLLFIIIFAIVAAIIYFVSRARARRAERRAAE